MKGFALIPVGAALAFLVMAAAPASAVTVSPAGPIGLTGSTTLTKSGNSIGCTAKMAGTISSDGAVSITSASFSGPAMCSLVSPTDLPWRGAATNAAGLVLDNVAVNVAVPGLGGQCGPTTINASILENAAQKETAINISKQPLTGGCEVSGTLTTTPYLMVN
jgi:hypothetical protein